MSGGGEAVLERACLELAPPVSGQRMSRMGLLVCLDHVLTVLEVGEWLPSCIMERVSLPFHEVLNARAMMSFLQDGFHFVL